MISWNEDHIPNQSGRFAIVTGATEPRELDFGQRFLPSYVRTGSPS